jgi:hypothetical protein
VNAKIEATATDGVADRGHVGAVGFQQQHAARRLFTSQQSKGGKCGLRIQ